MRVQVSPAGFCWLSCQGGFFGLCVYLFIFDCAGSLLLRRLFFGWGEQGASPHCSMQASHCGGLSCGAWALGQAGFGSSCTWAQ